VLLIHEPVLGLDQGGVSVSLRADDFGKAVTKHPATQDDRVKLSGSFAPPNCFDGTIPARTKSFARNQSIVRGMEAWAVVVLGAGSSGFGSRRRAHKQS
jgi:hypothetical protein